MPAKGERGCRAWTPLSRSGFLGDWQGFARIAEGTSRLVLQIRVSPTGEILAFLSLPDRAAMAIPFDTVSLDGRRIRAEMASQKRPVTGELQEDDTVLVGHADSPQGDMSVRLLRNHPDFLAYEFPRLAPSGRPQTAYSYQAPPRLDDGLEVATAAEVGLREISDNTT